jgi:type I restriction enzyme M protein
LIICLILGKIKVAYNLDLNMANNKTLEQRLWGAADQLRANSGLKSNQYSQPVLGLIFLRFADFKFSVIDENLHEKQTKNSGASVVRDREYGPSYYQSKGVMYIPPKARYRYLLNLPEGENIGKAINEAMRGVEEHNPDLKGILPKTYTRIEDDLLIGLLKNFSEIPMDVEGDMFGKIYEYFLGKFAMAEGQKGGEFFTPRSLVKLIVEILEPFKGRVFDPACGSGGMFVQSAQFINEHRQNGKDASSLMAIYGQEKTLETAHLCKLNIAVHGLSGDIKQANTIYEDLHKSVGKFDYVMANPPFNVKGVDREKVKGDNRYHLGIPSTDNANYLWIQIFNSALNEKGRAGFVMANSASDARGTELEIRKKLIEDGAVDVMIAISSNFFYTVTLPVTLWFLDKAKQETNRKDKVLFIDARETYKQIDRAHREFSEEQIQKIAGIVRSYREEKGAEEYKDIPGFCKVATIKDIKAQGYSLNPGRYVGTAETEENDEDFEEKVKELTKEFETLTKEAHKFEEDILGNVKKLDL